MKRCAKCLVCHGNSCWVCPACGFAPLRIDGLPAFAPESAIADRGFKPEVFAELALVEAESFWFQSRNRLIIWALRRYFPQMRCYLEIGCGTGFVLESVANAYPKAKLTGSEILSAGLPFAAKRVEHAELLQMDARWIPYQNEFEVIGAFDVLEHIKEDEDVLREIHQALVLGGGALFTVPQHPSLWSSADEYACHVRRYRVGELKDKLVQAGFQVEMETSFVSLLLPAMFAARLLKRDAPGQESSAELRLPKVINGIFSLVMTIERCLIRIGVRFQFGGSVLLVVRKRSNGSHADTF
jgi:SAM-dependent methyltransferase